MKLNKKQLKEIHEFATKIQPVYKLLKWSWWNTGIPTVKEIEECLIMLFTDWDKDSFYHATGGLYVEKETEENGGTIEFGFSNSEILSR